MVAAGLIVAALTGSLAGPHFARVVAEFGGPLGPPGFSTTLTMQRHDPPALLVNALRQVTSTLVVPVPAVNRAVADTVIAVAAAVGVDPQDPAITLVGSGYASPFPTGNWRPDEDNAPFPVQSALLLTAVVAALVGRRVPGPVRAYAVTVAAVLLTYVVCLKWQIWGNRLIIGSLVIGAPVAGWWLERCAAATRARSRGVLRSAAATALVAVLAAGFAYGYGSVAFGKPRRLLGAKSVFATPEWEQRFRRFPQWQQGYQDSADAVRRADAVRIGLAVEGNGWAYPWQLMLPDRDPVWLQSSLPRHAPTRPEDTDAVLCAGSVAWCAQFVPAGWRFVVTGWGTGYALRPA